MNGKFSVWASVKVRECYNEVEQEDERRQSIVLDILQKSTDLLRRIIVPIAGQGRSPCRTCALIVADPRLKTAFGGFRLATARGSAAGGLAAARIIGKDPNRILVIQTARTTEKQKCFERTRCHTESATT